MPGSYVNMGSAVDFLERSMRGSKVGGEAIAPTSRKLLKKQRKGIGTLPSLGNLQVPPPLGGRNPFHVIPSSPRD